LVKGKERRAQLARWEPEQRRKTLETLRVERNLEGEIRETISGELRDFSGAEAPDSKGARRMLRRIKPLQFRDGGRMQAALRDRLHDFQIRNNRDTLARDPRSPD
jgi:hypothetical protein